MRLRIRGTGRTRIGRASCRIVVRVNLDARVKVEASRSAHG
ncbi:hypothetical protein A7982_12371 [Minicystis rosea]|nr:hypothetical protein A7982_12371 [Minicystis rosea]